MLQWHTLGVARRFAYEVFLLPWMASLAAPTGTAHHPAIAHLSEKQGETWKHLEPRAGMEAVELAAGSGATASDTILDERHGMRLAPQVQGWCSWCCQWHYHQLVEECLLTRDVYKCQGCLRRTLACRRACGAFARGFDVWDEERCAACEGRVRHGTAATVIYRRFVTHFILGVCLV